MSAKKRIISVILCFAMVIGMCATTFAAESIPDIAAGTIPDIAGVTQEDYMKEVEDTLKGYIRMEGIDTTNLSMSQPMPINGADAENMRMIFLFRDKKCIGLMSIAYVDNEYASSFVEMDDSAITDAFNKNQSIALVSGEACMVMLTDDDWSFVSGLEDSVDETALNRTKESYERQVLSLTPIVFSGEEATYSSRNASAHFLPVPKVKNEKSPDTGEWMCWAASMVSIIRYRTGKSSVTVQNLNAELKKKYPYDQYGYPMGSDFWKMRSYILYGLSYTHAHSGATYNEVKSSIDNERPIYAALQNINGKATHGVVIRGYETAGNDYSYQLMDPNATDKYHKVNVPSTTATSFTYSTSYGKIYKNWFCHLS